MDQMIIGTDGSEAASAAVRWGARLAAGTGAEVIVATSFEPVLHNLPGAEWPRRRAELDEEFDGWCQPLRDLDVAYRAVVIDTSPSFGLPACADDHDADLIVIGSRGAGGFSGLLLGSTADHLAHTTSRPLAVVPPGWSGDVDGGIVIGLDGSAGSDAAAAWLGPVAARLGSPVVAVNVHHQLLGWVPASDERSWVQQARNDLEGPWSAPLREAGLEPSYLQVDDEHPADTLVAAGQEAGAAMVVVGTRASRAPLRPRLGGVTMQLLHNLDGLPVVIVPPTP